MRLLTILSVLYVLSSCSAQFHLERAAKHQEKALKKGATINIDTTVIYKTDTLTEIFERNDTIFITRTIDKYITLPTEIRYITKKDKRKERKRERVQDRRTHKEKLVSIRQDGKTERTEIRRSKRNLWYVWLLIGLVLGFIFNKLLKYFVNYPQI